MNYLLNPVIIGCKKDIMSKLKEQKFNPTQVKKMTFNLEQVLFKSKQDRLNFIIEINLLYQSKKIPHDIKEYLNYGINNLSKIDNIDKLVISFLLNEILVAKNFSFRKREE